MMEFYVAGQNLKLFSPVIAADTLHYLTARVSFTDDSWEGYTRWLHFRQGETVYDLALNENNEITADMGLNLTVGEWEVYLTGVGEEARLTTVPLIITVKASGLIDAPLHAMPLSVAEQVDSKAATALRLAQELKAAADRGDFDGADGKSFVIAGYYDTFADLTAAMPEPETGTACGVGTAAPYDIYVWDEVNARWINNGSIQGVRGDRGETGATFTPSVDANGNLSWVNDGGLENPVPRNITGPAGRDGDAGPAGPSAYEAAAEAGYTGTEATFYAALAAIPYHNARHLPDGADPIVVKTGNLENGAVTADKLAANAVSRNYTAIIGTAWQGESAPFTQTVSVPGLLEEDRPFVGLLPSESFETAEQEIEAFGCFYRMTAGRDSLTVYATEKTAVAAPVQIKAVRK
ncbi:MAG: hypothetical protein IJV41_01290 [Oscillospiraceae bacterium]|nr:hypothetical protein [Oscillospiraceae bacterium]